MMDGIEASDAQPTSSTVDTKVLLGRKPTSCNASSLGITPPLFISVLAGLLFGLLIALTGADPLCPLAIAPNVTACEATPPADAPALTGRRGKVVYAITAEGKERFADLVSQTGPEAYDDEGRFGVHLAFFRHTAADVRLRHVF